MAVIVNDMSEVNIDAQLVGGPRATSATQLSRTEEKLVEFSNGCICCTLREDLLEEVARLAREDRFEFANVLVITKTDLVAAPDVAYLEAILRKLNPTASIMQGTQGRVPVSALLGTKLFDMDHAASHPGWLAEAPGTHVPESEEYGIVSRVFRSRRPLHPQRFWNLITGPSFKGVIRSKGFVWLATRHDWAGIWSSAGVVSSLQPGGLWLASSPRNEWPDDLDLADVQAIWHEPWGDRRQELVVIGAALVSDLLVQLDRCCLSDAEIDLGPESWLAFDDPFPAWRIALEDDEDTVVADEEND